MERTGQRTRYIDFARGLCMLAVLWGHIMLGGRTNYLVYAFHMPTFFFLSGLVFRREKYPRFGGFLFRRVRTLLLPYAIFSLITWLWWVGLNRLLGTPVQQPWKPLLQTLLAQGSGGYLVHNVALWFIPCLFLVEVLWYWIGKLPRWAALLTAAVLAAAGQLLLLQNPPPVSNNCYTLEL